MDVQEKSLEIVKLVMPGEGPWVLGEVLGALAIAAAGVIHSADRPAPAVKSYREAFIEQLDQALEALR